MSTQHESNQPTSAQLIGNGAGGEVLVGANMTDAEDIVTRPYPFDLDPVAVALNEDGITYTHRVRKSSFEVEERRERMTEVKRYTLGKAEVKNEGGEQERAQRSRSEAEDVNASLRYYRDLIGTVTGYDPDDPLAERDPRSVIMRGGENDEPVVTQLDDLDLGIPTAHRLFVANNVYGGEFEVDKATRFVAGAGRTWKVHHRIGQKTRGDGTKSPAMFEVVYEFAEPTDALVRLFRSSALNSTQLDLNGGDVMTIRTVNLAVVTELFDGVPNKGRGVIRITGGTVGGETIDIRDPAQLALVAPPFKKNCMILLYARLLNDLGN